MDLPWVRVRVRFRARVRVRVGVRVRVRVREGHGWGGPKWHTLTPQGCHPTSRLLEVAAQIDQPRKGYGVGIKQSERSRFNMGSIN